MNNTYIYCESEREKRLVIKYLMSETGFGFANTIHQPDDVDISHISMIFPYIFVDFKSRVISAATKKFLDDKLPVNIISYNEFAEAYNTENKYAISWNIF